MIAACRHKTNDDLSQFRKIINNKESSVGLNHTEDFAFYCCRFIFSEANRFIGLMRNRHTRMIRISAAGWQR